MTFDNAIQRVREAGRMALEKAPGEATRAAALAELEALQPELDALEQDKARLELAFAEAQDVYICQRRENENLHPKVIRLYQSNFEREYDESSAQLKAGRKREGELLKTLIRLQRELGDVTRRGAKLWGVWAALRRLAGLNAGK